MSYPEVSRLAQAVTIFRGVLLLLGQKGITLSSQAHTENEVLAYAVMADRHELTVNLVRENDGSSTIHVGLHAGEDYESNLYFSICMAPAGRTFRVTHDGDLAKGRLKELQQTFSMWLESPRMNESDAIHSFVNEIADFFLRASKKD